jgi:hypothetical protein
MLLLVVLQLSTKLSMRCLLIHDLFNDDISEEDGLEVTVLTCIRKVLLSNVGRVMVYAD